MSRRRSQHSRKPRTSGWSLEGNGETFYQRVKLHQRGLYHDALSIIRSEADGCASAVHGKVVLLEQISIRRICDVQSSSDNSDQWWRSAEMVDYLFIYANSFGVGISDDNCFKPLGPDVNNWGHRRRCYRSDRGCVAGRVCHVEKC